MTEVVGEGWRLISSHVSQPTSPIQSSLVIGRTVKRNGLRKPYATIRRAFGSELDAAGLSGMASPVEGSTRRTAPFRSTGSPLGRRKLWARRAPPSAVGGVSFPPDPAGGSPHGFLGVGLPELPPPCP